MILILKNSPEYFDPVALWIGFHFEKEGIPFMFVSKLNLEDTENIYIIFHVHDPYSKLPPKFIAYNFEQFCSSRETELNIVNRFRKAIQIWDYSLLNIPFYEKHGMKADFVPFFSKIFTVVTPQPEKFGWFKIGCASPRRVLIVNTITERPCLASANTFNEELLEVYSKYIVGLNIHHYDKTTILEILRIYPMILNNIWVISERSSDKFYDDLLKDVVDFVHHPSEFQPRIKYILNLDKKILQEQLEKRRLKFLSLINTRYSFQNFRSLLFKKLD